MFFFFLSELNSTYLEHVPYYLMSIYCIQYMLLGNSKYTIFYLPRDAIPRSLNVCELKKRWIDFQGSILQNSITQLKLWDGAALAFSHISSVTHAYGVFFWPPASIFREMMWLLLFTSGQSITWFLCFVPLFPKVSECRRVCGNVCLWVTHWW